MGGGNESTGRNAAGGKSRPDNFQLTHRDCASPIRRRKCSCAEFGRDSVSLVPQNQGRRSGDPASYVASRGYPPVLRTFPPKLHRQQTGRQSKSRRRSHKAASGCACKASRRKSGRGCAPGSGALGHADGGALFVRRREVGEQAETGAGASGWCRWPATPAPAAF